MKAYITKYALTRGIIEINGLETGSGSFINVNQSDKTVYLRGEWHTHEANAQNKAEMMRDNEIASLEKQIKILKNKTF